MGDFRVEAELGTDGSEERLARDLEDIIRRALGNAADDIGRQLRGLFDPMTQGAKKAERETRRVKEGVKDVAEETARVTRQTNAMADGFKAIRTQAAKIRFEEKSFNIVEQSMALLQSQLRGVDELMDRVARNPGISKAAIAQLDLFRTGLTQSVATINTLVGVTKQAEKSRTQVLNNESRERIALVKSEASQRIVAEQGANAKLLADTRAAAQRRVEIFRFAVGQIRALERGLAATLRTTTGALGGLGRGVGSGITGIARALTRQNQQINQGLDQSLNRRETILRSSFRNQERIITQSAARQSATVERLNAQLSTGVVGAATGRSNFPFLAAGAGLGAGLGIGALLTSGFERFSNLERINKQFEALIGNQQQAAALLEEVKVFAKQTPFDLVGVADLAKGFLAIGTAAEDVLPRVRVIADAVALTGGGVDELVRIQRAIGQVVSAGRLQGDELNQLAENLPGLNIRKILADQLTGGDTAAIVAMQEAGELSADTFVNALLAGLGGDPRLVGASEDLAKTLGGRVANLKESFADLGASIIGVFAGPLKSAILATQTALQGLADFVKGEVSPALLVLRTALAGAAAGIGVFLGLKVGIELLKLLAIGIRAVFTPMGLLITAIALAGAAINTMLNRSAAFREALAQVGETIQTLVAPAVEYVTDLLDRFGEFITANMPRVERALTTVLDGFRRGLEFVGNFIRDVAIPALQSFAGFVMDDVVPAVGRFLVDAFDAAKRAIEAFVDFASPVLEPIGRALSSIGETIRTALSERSLAPIGAAISEAFNAAVDAVTGFVSSIRETLSNLIDGGILADIGAGALQIVETIGFYLANIVSDPRFVTALAAVAAAAALVVIRFVEGLGRGLIENIPELTELFLNAIEAALRGAASALLGTDSLAVGIALAVAGGFIAGSAIAAFRRVGQAWAGAASQGFLSRSRTALGSARGATAGDFFTGLFGGQAGIQRSAAQFAETTRRATVQAVQRAQRDLKALTGKTLSNIGPFNADALRKVNEAIGQATRGLSAAQVQGRLFGDALGRSLDAVRTRNFPALRQTLSDLGRSLAPAARAAGEAIGVTLAAGIGAALSGRQLGGASSGGEAAFGLAGIAASAFGAFTLLGGGVQGGIAAAAVAGIGLITAAFQDNAEAAQAAADAARSFRDAGFEILSSGAPVAGLIDTLTNIVRGLDASVLAPLAAAGITVRELAGDFQDGSVNTEDYRRRLEAAGLSGLALEGVLANITGLFRTYQTETKAAADAQKIIGDETEETTKASTGLVGSLEKQIASLEKSKVAADATTDALREIAEAQVEAAKLEVDELRGSLDEAATAADAARERLIAFLTGDYANSASEAVNQFIVGLPQLGAGINEALAGVGSTIGDAVLTQDVAALQAAIAEVISAGILDGTIKSGADLPRVLGPMRTAVEEAIRDGVITAEAGFVILSEIDKVTAGKAVKLTNVAVDAEAAKRAGEQAVEAAEAGLAARELKLSKVNIATSGPDSASSVIAKMQKALDAAVAQQDFSSTGREVSRGFAAGILAGAAEAVNAARSLANQVKTTMEKTLKISSPSQVAINIGANVGAGLVRGMDSSAATVTASAQRLGDTVAVAVGDAAAQVPAVVNAEKPKVLDAGYDLGNGLVLGMNSSGTLIIQAAQGMVDQIITGFEDGVPIMENRATLIAQQIADAFSSTLTGDIASAVANAFSASIPSLAGIGGTSNASVQQAFLALADLPLDFVSSNQQIAQQIFDAAAKAAKGEFLTAAEADFLGESFLSLDTGDRAGRANRAAFIDALEQIRQYGELSLASGKDIGTVNFELKSWRDNLISAAQAQGFNVQQLYELVELLGLTNAQLDAFASTIGTVGQVGEMTAQQLEEAWYDSLPTGSGSSPAEFGDDTAEVRAGGDSNAPTPTPVTLPPPVFRDLIIQPPTGDPEAIALATVNRIAYALPGR